MSKEENGLVCAVCEEPRPPGSDLCPHCEDLKAVAVAYGRPNPVREPPHGNTTR